MSKIMRCSVVALMVAESVAPAVVYAQNVPSSVESGSFERSQRPVPKATSTGEVLIPAPSTSAGPPEAAALKFTLKSLEITGAKTFSPADFGAYYSSLIGQEISLATLFDIAAKITQRYADGGYSLSLAYVPEQKIGADGIARINVVEGYVGSVDVVNVASSLKEVVGRRFVPVTGERPITTATLERSLLLANDLPGVTVKSVIDRSEEGVGATKLVADTKLDRISIDGGINNRGTRALGPTRADATLLVNVPEWLGSQFRVSGLTTVGSDELHYIAGGYSSVLTRQGTTLGLNFAYNDSRPGTQNLRLLDFLTSGYTYGVSLRHPFIRSRTRNLSATVSLDFSDLDSSFLGRPRTNENIRSLRVGASYDWFDKTGAITVVSAQVSRGLGWFSGTPSRSSSLGRADGDTTYTAISADVERLQPIADRWTLSLKASGQVAFDPLVSSEQCGFGGARLGRAYDSFEISGDHCLSGSAELAWQPPLGFLSSQVYGFYDIGGTWLKTAAPGTDKSQWRHSLGTGLRIAINRHIDVNVEGALPLNADVQLTNSRAFRLFGGVRAHF